MQGKTRVLIKAVGIIAIILGAIPLLNYLLLTITIVKPILVGAYPAGKFSFLLVIVAASMILPLAKVIAGYGLLRIIQWARKAAIAIFTIEFLLVFTGAANFCVQCYRFRNIPAVIYDRAMFIETVNMWPTYIFALVSLLFIAILSRPSIKEIFSGQSAELT